MNIGPHNLWFIYAISASIMWGLGYVLSEKLLRSGMTPTFLLVISNMIMLPFLIGAMFLLNQHKGQWQAMLSSKSSLAEVVLMSGLIIGGNLLILASIQGKNATLATIIEITYPIFTFIFAWIIFKENQLNITQAFGGLLILSGICLIFVKS